MTTLNKLAPAAIAAALKSLEEKTLLAPFQEPPETQGQFIQARPAVRVSMSAALADLRHDLALRAGRISG